ncbi:MAG: hypothetical protein IJ867_03825, partial [Clostridia bacterium]|nr:hypothetical protein [Clostridia bacterium]
NPKVFCNTRFALRRMSGSGYRFFYSLNTNKSEFDNGYSEYYWSSSGSGLHHNIQLPVDFDFSDNNEIYLTLVVNPKSYDGSSKYICQDLYINGVKSVSSYLDINYWNTFLNTQISMIYVGKMSYGDYLSFVTLKGKIYAIRLYNKALSDDDVWKNYSSSVSYRSY